jgi:hypothetical protein
MSKNMKDAGVDTLSMPSFIGYVILGKLVFLCLFSDLKNGEKLTDLKNKWKNVCLKPLA